MLEHLISHDFDPVVCETASTGFVGLERTRPDQVLSAQMKTADWLEETGLTAEKVAPEAIANTARTAFTALTAGANVTPETQRNALVAMTVPEEIRHIVGMLTAYDWEFVHQAQQLRGYVVAKLVEETQNPTASIRLKALGLLGKVTEVGLFTDKIEVTKKDMSDEEINQRIKDKIGAFLRIEDAAYTDVEPNDAPDTPSE